MYQRPTICRALTFFITLTMLSINSWSLAEASSNRTGVKKLETSRTQSIEVYGVGYLGYKVPQKPSSVYNQGAFDIDRIYLRFNFYPRANEKVHITLEGGDLRDSSGVFEVYTKNFYYELSSLAGIRGAFLRFGQISTPWVSHGQKTFPYRMLGADGKALLDRYKYQGSADMGLSFGYKPSRWFDGSLTTINGEGIKSDEQGPNKDTLLMLNFRVQENTVLSVFSSRGNYEGIDIDKSSRHRTAASLFYKNSSLKLYAEYAEMEDATDKASSLADKVSIPASRAGEIMRGVGTRISFDFSLGFFSSRDWMKRLSLFGRADQLNPDKEVEKNGLQSSLWGLSQKFGQGHRWVMALSNTRYEDNHGGVENELFLLQTEIKF